MKINDIWTYYGTGWSETVPQLSKVVHFVLSDNIYTWYLKKNNKTNGIMWKPEVCEENKSQDERELKLRGDGAITCMRFASLIIS